MPASISSLPLAAVRAFEAAARLGSFKGAAAELAVTPAAISHQVKALESYLGTTLFVRVHRGLTLTEAGQRLAASAHSAIVQLRRGLDELVADGLIAGQTTLSISASPSLAGKWLAPRLHLFRALRPEVELRLRADESLDDPSDDRRVDVSLRYGPGPYARSLQAERLWSSVEVFPVCSPEVGALLREPGDLLGATLLRTARPRGPARGDPIGWLAWFEAAGVVAEKARAAYDRAPLLGTSQLALETAAAGRGVALAPCVLVADDLKSGRLLRPFATSLADASAYWLLCRRERSTEVRIRAFSDWVRVMARDTPCG